MISSDDMIVDTWSRKFAIGSYESDNSDIHAIKKLKKKKKKKRTEAEKIAKLKKKIRKKIRKANKEKSKAKLVERVDRAPIVKTMKRDDIITRSKRLPTEENS